MQQYFKNPEVFEFVDIMKQDVSYLLDLQQPQQQYKGQIVIDYGSNTTKAGYANQSGPQMVFRSLVNRIKDPKTLLNTCQIATRWREIDIFKGSYISPYERNLIHHSGIWESLNDHIFSELKLYQHPLIVTECFGNAEYARANMIEQFFECYEVPSVMLGVDTLFGVYANRNENGLTSYLGSTQLIVSVGDRATHVVPMIDGQVMYQNIKRVNVGGHTCLNYFYRTMLSRYAHLKQYLSFQVLEKLHRLLTLVAYDYKEQLNYFKDGVRIFDKRAYRDSVTEGNENLRSADRLVEPVVIKFPFVKVQQGEDDQKRKSDMRGKQGERLREALARKKEEKHQQCEKQLAELEEILEKYRLEPGSVNLEAIVGEKKGLEELKKRIKILKVKTGRLSKESLEEDKYNLVEVNDDKLTPEQLNQKRYQIMMKEQQKIKQEKKIEDQQRKEEAKKFREEQPEKYIDILHERRLKLLKKLNDRKKKQQEMNTRNSRFNQRRMQTLAYLGAQETKEGDTFGMRDEDWGLYRDIARELDSDDENLEFKLQELEIELRETDPNYDDRIIEQIANVHQLGMDINEITLSVDRVRCNELYFQPSIAGIDQCNLIEAIKFSLRGLSSSDQQKLLGNVFLIGGGVTTTGFKERLERELRSEFDSEWKIEVSMAKDPLFDPIRGMQSFYQKYGSMVNQFSISKEEYHELGSDNPDLFKAHPFSNVIIDQ